jgi:hypothetical protein
MIARKLAESLLREQRINISALSIEWLELRGAVS